MVITPCCCCKLLLLYFIAWSDSRIWCRVETTDVSSRLSTEVRDSTLSILWLCWSWMYGKICIRNFNVMFHIFQLALFGYDKQNFAVLLCLLISFPYCSFWRFFVATTLLFRFADYPLFNSRFVIEFSFWTSSLWLNKYPRVSCWRLETPFLPTKMSWN